MNAFLEQPEFKLLLALGIGLLVGVERERSKGAGPTRGAAGLRTFALIGLVGGVAGLFGQPLLTAVAGLFVAAAAVASYRRSRPDDPGLTTEVAMFATFLLGVMTADRPQAAVAAGVVMAVLLAARAPLQALVRDVLTQRELMDGLAFAIAALVVLPLLPDRAVDPLGVLNPFALWRLAVVMMGLSALGYVAQRLAGGRRGLLLAGLAGGLVSSTATIAGMARRARETPASTAAAASAALDLNTSPEGDQRRAKLRELAALLDPAPPAAIHPVIIGSEEDTLRASDQMAQLGFHVPAIRPPTVPKGTSRLRVSLSAAHDQEVARTLAAALRAVTAPTPAATGNPDTVCPVCGASLVSEKCKVVCRSAKCGYRIVFNCSEF